MSDPLFPVIDLAQSRDFATQPRIHKATYLHPLMSSKCRDNLVKKFKRKAQKPVNYPTPAFDVDTHDWLCLGLGSYSGYFARQYPQAEPLALEVLGPQADPVIWNVDRIHFATLHEKSHSRFVALKPKSYGTMEVLRSVP